MIRRRVGTLLLLLFTVTGVAIRATHPEIYTQTFESPVLNGFDITTYYTKDQPEKGDPNIEVTYAGKRWFFTTEENKERFLLAPEKYIPAFNGWCAWALAQGRLTVSDPLLYFISDGKLYLFCSKIPLQKFQQNPERLIKEAQIH